MQFGDPRLPVRFWDKVVPEPMSGCWLWTGTVNYAGYGKFETGDRRHSTRKIHRAHRFAYEALVHPIADGLLVCHRCDVRACLNPEHLFLGTDADNAYDSIDKGRVRSSLCVAKLSADQVSEIRSRSDAHAALAVEFGVARQTIGKIRNGQRWRRAASIEGIQS